MNFSFHPEAGEEFIESVAYYGSAKPGALTMDLVSQDARPHPPFGHLLPQGEGCPPFCHESAAFADRPI